MGKRPHRAAARLTRTADGLTIKFAIPGLPIATPDPFAASLGGSETAGLQLSGTGWSEGHRVTVFCRYRADVPWRGVGSSPCGGAETATARRPVHRPAGAGVSRSGAGPGCVPVGARPCRRQRPVRLWVRPRRSMRIIGEPLGQTEQWREAAPS